MRCQKYYIAFDENERRIILNALNVLRNKLLTSSRLNTYLADIDNQAEEIFFRLVEQMKQAQGITERLKEENALEWIRRFNNIRAYAREVVEKEIIYC